VRAAGLRLCQSAGGREGILEKAVEFMDQITRLGKNSNRLSELSVRCGLKLGYRTIGDFRKDNWKALKAVNREFVLMMRQLKLAGEKVVAIDGAFFDGNDSKASITPHERQHHP
jgi:hypothetical protein